MTLDMLSAFNEATKEADAFENHPVQTLGLEEQLLYLQGLAMVMNADNHIHQSEKEYLSILIKSFGLNSSVIDDCIEFSQLPDKATIQAFISYYRRKPIAQLFLFDALMMTRRDGKVHDKEMALVNAMAVQLEILKGTQQDIFELFCHIKNKNWQESAVFFNSFIVSSKYYKHLLTYHGVDYDELIASSKNIRKSKLQELIEHKLGSTAKEFKWKKLERKQVFFLIYKENLSEKNSGLIREIKIMGGVSSYDLACKISSNHLKDNTFYEKGDVFLNYKKNQFSHGESLISETIKLDAPIYMLKVLIKEEQELTHQMKLAKVTFKTKKEQDEYENSNVFSLKAADESLIVGGINNELSIKLLLNSELIQLFLQYLLERNQIRVVNKIVLKNDESENEYCNLSMLGINFDQENHCFNVITSKDVPYNQTNLPITLLNDLYCDALTID